MERHVHRLVLLNLGRRVVAFRKCVLEIVVASGGKWHVAKVIGMISMRALFGDLSAVKAER